MAKFRVWYRADEIGPAQFSAVVTCVRNFTWKA